MRQRKANLFFPNHGLLENNDGDLESNSSQSDHEDTILATHPDEETGPREMAPSRSKSFLRDLAANKTKWSQCVTIALAALATYSYHTVGATANVQISIMTIITLVGASPFCKTHLTTASIGAFVGGQNIIGATHKLTEPPVVADAIYSKYLWLMVLSLGVGLVWTHFVTHPRIKLLDGYSGRLGSTTFIGMNLVMVLVWGPLGVVGWNRYYYGLIDIVHVAEEDSAPLASAWSWTEEIELAIGYVLAVVWLGAVSGVTRIKHNQYIQEWQQQHNGEENAPTPLNNVLIPVLFSLLSILLVNATNYKHAAGLYNGFAVGAYVGMASLQRIPSVAKFATISLTAALWGLTLTPFFVGFAGKSGFTSMMGHVTHEAVETFVWKKIQYRLQRKQRLEQQQRQAFEEEEQRRQEEKERVQKQKHQEEQERLLQERQKEPYHPPHKPSRKKELVLSTKQQRRQQQRLKQQQQQQNRNTVRPQKQATQEAAPLRHRAWVASPAEGDGIWEHPQLHEVSTSKTSKLDVV
eukprot:CAMPEP_0116120436 /NCGR_PEP_ID=MMETSP0329-20121206/3174_1 /TAXON_ID=697910 /ORGANISM="Pseudo-nitzschia arenysensis, Strain B593" /LENGTH=521 /DNA_ID=CAMNT_0003614205 /DNA_START=112 /DNA_END=1677 /DNA_ORIENTATION=-